MPKLPAAAVIAAIPAGFFTVAIFRVKLILGDLPDGSRAHGLANRGYSGRIGSRNRRAGPGHPRRGGWTRNRGGGRAGDLRNPYFTEGGG